MFNLANPMGFRDIDPSRICLLAAALLCSTLLSNVQAQPDVSAINFGDDASIWAFDGQCDDPRFAGRNMSALLLDIDMFHDAADCRQLASQGSIRLLPGSNLVIGGRFERGRLLPGDDSRANGSFSDSYRFIADRGDSTVIDLRSGEFDTFLIVRAPNGEEFSNDDYGMSFDRSLISIPRTETGIYEVVVSSFSAGESGGYTLEITTDYRPLDSLNQQIGGVLIDEDSRFDDGGFYDSYSFEGRPGQSILLDLRSDQFDTYLVLRQPNGQSLFNDDSDASNSSIATTLTEAGSYEVIVSAYVPGATGEYRLSIADTTDPARNPLSEVALATLQLGDSIAGDLADDAAQDSYYLQGSRGETVVIDLSSSDFDSVLELQTPSGELFRNDDFQGSLEGSQLRLRLRETGRHRILVSAYSPGETGAYRLSIGPVEMTTAASATAQLFGLFVGIADYPGNADDLDRTDRDVLRARDALLESGELRPENAHTLLNGDATRANLRATLEAIDTEIGDADTLVIFYAGGGDRLPRAAGPNRSEPDGMDETIELYDGPLLDDELAALLDSSSAGSLLLLMDSRFSAGFAKDVLSSPGRIGIFSSAEDLSPQLASKFKAGGFLSVFFSEAMQEGGADRDGNGELGANELTRYLHGRYLADTKSAGSAREMRRSGPRDAYQRLLVEQSDVDPYRTLLKLD